MAEKKEKNKSGAGKFFLGAALGALAGAIAGKFISVNKDEDCECGDKCDCEKKCKCEDSSDKIVEKKTSEAKEPKKEPTKSKSAEKKTANKK